VPNLPHNLLSALRSGDYLSSPMAPSKDSKAKLQKTAAGLRKVLEKLGSFTEAQFLRILGAQDLTQALDTANQLNDLMSELGNATWETLSEHVITQTMNLKEEWEKTIESDGEQLEDDILHETICRIRKHVSPTVSQ
jgi:hypothetical protein